MALLGVLALFACAPPLPAGVDKARLQEGVDRAIGDPNTCVLIAEAGSTRPSFRYNTHTVCARSLPSCEGSRRSAGDLLAEVARDGQPRLVSCPTAPDGSRDVAWAAGPIAGRPLIYVAVMEGERAVPGRVMAERLAGAFADAGL